MLKQAGGLWRVERCLRGEQSLNLLPCFIGVANLLVRPPSPRNETVHFVEAANHARLRFSIFAEVDSSLVSQLIELGFDHRPAAAFRRAMNDTGRGDDFIHLQD